MEKTKKAQAQVKPLDAVYESQYANYQPRKTVCIAPEPEIDTIYMINKCYALHIPQPHYTVDCEPEYEESGEIEWDGRTYTTYEVVSEEWTATMTWDEEEYVFSADTREKAIINLYSWWIHYYVKYCEESIAESEKQAREDAELEAIIAEYKKLGLDYWEEDSD